MACGSKPDVKEFADSANAKEEITNLEAAINNSRAEQLDLLAPVNYKEARNSLSEAKSMMKDDKKDEKVLHEVALGKAYLERARKYGVENKKRLHDVVVAREAAISAQANTLLPKEFARVDNEVKEQTANIENDDKNEIKEERADYIAGYMGLELNAIKKTHIGESKNLIDKSVKEGARDLTPQTLAAAQKSYMEVDNFITENRHNTSEIQLRAAVALEAARKLDATTSAARGLTAATPEQTALKMQAEEERLKNATNDLNNTNNALATEQGANAALAASNSNLNSDLEKQKQLDANYDAARSKFSPNEAEVYKQGKNLVIRLRGLEFPTSQAVLKGENFGLLKKVQEVITSFDKSSVMVEGHTDSQGGKKINQKLSTERAEAVKAYLEANSSDKVSGFESKGYGFEKPLASNKTAAGRAQNRRVDVIIEPAQM
jgi:outer membrane protein OmpA-like peptidoglycan-associated protein